MNRIEQIFSDLAKQGKKGVMPFIVAGDPSLEAMSGILQEMDQSGADIIEIGIPFSDPIADGPVIAAAMYRALSRGTTPEKVCNKIADCRDSISAGLVAMVSHSIVRKCGGTVFIEQLADAGFDGVIIPDIDSQKAIELSSYCNSLSMSFSMLIAPTTPIERVAELASISSGFLYVLARTGLTGVQQELPNLQNRLKEIRSLTQLPLAVGFGISNAEQVKVVNKWADAAIVGSALVLQLASAAEPNVVAGQFVTEIS